MLQRQNVTPQVERNLLFGEASKDQIQNNFNRESVTKKIIFARILYGKITKKIDLGESWQD